SGDNAEEETSGTVAIAQLVHVLVSVFQDGESDGDFGDNHRKDGAADEEEEPCDPLGAQTVLDDDRHRDDSRCPADNSHTIDGEHPSAAVAEPPVAQQANGQSLSPNLDESVLILRRKSNRISKPIQRSLESASAATTSPTISVHKKIGLIFCPLRSMFTVFNDFKHNLLQNNAIACESDKSAVNRSAKADESAPKSSSKGGKSLRKLQMWTNEDTKCFFEAICEHGKDFPRIQSYMAQRCEKKGIPQDQIKNYEQVRHYYYRMWHKIANSMAPNEVVDKNIQEIYGLINYGEIWKKFGTKFDNKLSISLQQLVNFGHTTFKVKKGRIRVKTPICNALKKIHKIKEVCIELHPANNESWLRVHSLSQNPRVRTKLSLQKRLSALVEYLERRWNQSRLKASECQTLCGTSLPNSSCDVCLRVRPQSSGHLNNVSLSKSYFNSSQMDLSLTAYVKTLYNQELKGKSKKSKTNKAKEAKDTNADPNGDLNMKSPTSGEPTVESSDDKPTETDNKPVGKECKTDSALNKSSEGEGKSDEDEPIGAAERSLALLQMLEKMNRMCEEIHGTDEEDEKEDDDQNKEEEDRDLPSPDTNANVCLPEPPANATLAQWLGTGDGEPEDNDNEVEGIEKKTPTAAAVKENPVSMLSADRARMGWSLSETGSMTIGELYLLFRCPKTILLEYVWEPIVPKVESSPNADNEESVVTSSDDTNANKEDNNHNVLVADNKAMNSEFLRRLLLAANVSLLSMKRPANASSAQNPKKKRIKPTQVFVPSVSPPNMSKPIDNSSQMLSNVIKNTIFNDSNSNEGNVAKTTPNPSTDGLSDGTAGGDPSTASAHDFIVPTTPAPKAVNKAKTRNVCGASIQEALRQLQSNKYTRRQRRPTPKPVFGQNKPLLPRGSPQTVTVVSTTTGATGVGQQQPIYVIPSQALHALTVNSQSAAAGGGVATATLPMIDVTALNASQLRQTFNSHTNSENTFNVILPQKAQQMTTTSDVNNKSTVNRLIDGINSADIPLIQMEPISSVSVPIISSTIHTTTAEPTLLRQTLLNSYSMAGTGTPPMIGQKVVSMFDTTIADHQKAADEPSDDRDVIKDKSVDQSLTISVGIGSVLTDSDANHPAITSSDESSDKLPLMSSNATISSLLEISLPEPPFNDNSCSSLTDGFAIDKRPFERLTLPDMTTSTTGAINNNHRHHPMADHRADNEHNRNTTDPTLLTSVSSSSSLASPPIDRHKLSSSPVSDSSHWLNGESCDLSIGTLLNACESPVKNVRDSHSLASDVSISQMSCLVTDNSVDLMAKFADLAAQIVDTNSKST
ncbi:unnamed protein product, partial [Medioppia subpectinata]